MKKGAQVKGNRQLDKQINYKKYWPENREKVCYITKQQHFIICKKNYLRQKNCKAMLLNKTKQSKPVSE